MMNTPLPGTVEAAGYQSAFFDVNDIIAGELKTLRRALLLVMYEDARASASVRAQIGALQRVQRRVNALV